MTAAEIEAEIVKHENRVVELKADLFDEEQILATLRTMHEAALRQEQAADARASAARRRTAEA